MAILLQLFPLNTNMTPLLGLITVFTVFTVLSIFTIYHKRKSSNLPPSPPALPIIGNLHQLGHLPHRALASLSQKYGPLILLKLGSVPSFVVSSSEIAEEMMKTQDLSFCDRPPSSMDDRLLYGSRDVAFTRYGQYWRQMRRICVLHLLSANRVQAVRSVREEEVALMLANIESQSPNPVDLTKILATSSTDIICRVALGRKYTEQKKFGEMLKEFYSLLGSFPIRDYIPWLGWVDELSGLNSRVRRNFEDFDGFLERVLEEHIVRGKGKTEVGNGIREGVDFVDVLLSLKEESAGSGFNLERESIKALILDMFAGGTDTTTGTVEWAIAELINHPISMRKVQEEIRRIIGSNPKVEEENIERMEYLKAVIKETLRLHPSVPMLVPRVAMQDTNLNGFKILIGTRVIINAWGIARDPKYWNKPTEFWPERFLDENIDFKGQHFHFIPFGSGRRSCPGMNFSITTIQYMLANLLHAFDWEKTEKKSEMIDMSESSGLTCHKKFGLTLIAKPYLGSSNATN